MRGGTGDSAGLTWVHGPVGRALRSALQRAIVFPLLRVVTPVTVRGSENLGGVGNPVIAVANHVSHLDTPVVLRALPGRVRRRLVVAAAKDYFYRSRLRGTLVALSMATVPFDRGEGSRDSLDQCETLLRSGRSLLIFPEGTRSVTGELGPIRRGVAVLATHTGVPVLPLFVHGLAQVMPKGGVAPLPGGVVVDVGDVVSPEPGEDVPAFRDRVEAALRELSARRPVWGPAAPHVGG